MNFKTSQSRGAFFYGTLMAPSVLHRVTRRPADQPFETWGAILPRFERHRVKNVDYPAIIASSDETSHVRGVYVCGLTDADMFALDIFEGEEYERIRVSVKLAGGITTESSNVKHGFRTAVDNQDTGLANDSGMSEREGETLVVAETYVWTSSPSDLEGDEWDYDEFVHEKLHRWAPASAEYHAVDAALNSAGHNGKSRTTDR